MIDRLKTTMNEAQIKELIETAASQAQQQQEHHQQPSSESKSYLSVVGSGSSSAPTTITISHDNSGTSNVLLQQQQQLFEALSSSTTNDNGTFDSKFDSQPSAHHQLQQYILQGTNHQQQQHQQQNLSITNNTAINTGHQHIQHNQQHHPHQQVEIPMVTNTLDINLLLQENQKLANISRVCIHLIDRCRNLSKSKHFVSDIEKLSTMIDAFNGNAASYVSGALPVLNNIGAMIFKFQHNGGVSQSTAPATSTTGTSAAQELLSRNANTLWLQLNGGNIDQSNQGSIFADQTTTTYIQQQVNTDNGPIQILKPVQLLGDGMTSNTANVISKPSANALKQRKRAQNAANKLQLNRLRLMANTAAVPEDAASQQSILFKKLTQAEQLSAASNGQAPSAPLSVQMMDFAGVQNIDPTTGQAVHFSLVHSDLNGNNNNNNGNNDMNNDKTKSKTYKCDICEKVFVNLYNLNRHGRTHSGHQPFICPYTECRKRFNYSYHLKRHIDTHLGTRNFPCTWPNCDQRFSRKYNLHRHLWVHTDNAKMKHSQPQIIIA